MSWAGGTSSALLKNTRNLRKEKQELILMKRAENLKK